jgi:hypothetical protein
VRFSTPIFGKTLDIVRYELEMLESLITEAIQNKNNEVKTVKVIEDEIERIKSALIKEVFSLKKDKFIEIYIQRHQEEVIWLLDKVTFDIKKPNESLLKVQQELETLLTFIEKHFSRYFDLSAKIPESYRSITAKDFSDRLPMLIERLESKGLEQSTLKTITESFTYFIGDKETKVSFHNVIYLKELYSELEELSELELDAKELDRMLCINMIYINFNTPKFLSHCAKVIKESYQSKSTLSEQLERLSHFVKLINQQQEKPGFSYKPVLKSLKTQLSEWVIEEIIYLEKKQQLSFAFKVDKTTESSMRKDFKILTESSVPQIAYFVRILMETGLIKNVIRFFSKHFRTARVETISPDSFRSKFYNTEHTAKEAVKDDVQKLLNHMTKSK